MATGLLVIRLSRPFAVVNPGYIGENGKANALCRIALNTLTSLIKIFFKIIIILMN